MKNKRSTFTAIHYGAAAFATAIFSMVAVLAVIGGTTSAETKDSESAAAAAAAELNTTPHDDTARPHRDRPPRRQPADRPAPPSFDDLDANGDGSITEVEFDAFRESHRPRGPRGPQQHARGDFDGPGHPRGGEFDGPPRGPRGGHGDRQGPPPRMRDGGHGEHRQGPPPHMRDGGPGEHRQGPPPHMRDGGRGEHRQGPPPHMRDGDGPRGPRPEGSGDLDRRPPRPDFDQFDSDGDGSISKQEFDNFRPPRGPRGEHDEFPSEESF